MPTEEVALALKVTWPVSVAPADGPVSETAGVLGGPPESISE